MKNPYKVAWGLAWSSFITELIIIFLMKANVLSWDLFNPTFMGFIIILGIASIIVIINKIKKEDGDEK